MSAVTKTLGAPLSLLDLTTPLAVGANYGRTLSATRVKQLVENWNERRAGIATVNRRQDGSLVIIDGQHLLEAARQKGFTQAYARLVTLPNIQAEAEMHRDLNLLQRKPGPQEVHRMNLAAGEQIAFAIEGLLNRFDLTGLHVSGANEVRAIATLRSAWGARGKIHGAQLNSVSLAAGFRALEWVLECGQPLIKRGEKAVHVYSAANIAGLLWIYFNAANRPKASEVRQALVTGNGSDITALLTRDPRNPNNLPKRSFRGIVLSAWLNQKTGRPVVDLDSGLWSSYKV